MTARIVPDYTYEDYKQWQGDWELIEGVPYAMAPSPVKSHQRLAGALFIALAEALEECEECEVLFEEDYKINEKTVLRPDVAVVCGDEEERYISIAPKIIIEVVSPSSASLDENYKFSIYAEEKVAYYGLAYPDEKLLKLYRNTPDGFDKMGDFRKERVELEFEDCTITLDLSRVFKRL